MIPLSVRGRSGGDTGSGVRRRQRPCVPERYGARNGGGHSPACPGREQGKGNRPRLPKLIQRLGPQRLGVDRQLAESALGHVVGGVEGAYLRSALVERRRPCMQAWADYVG